MKGIIFFLLSFLLFFQSLVTCTDWSTSKKISDTSFVITKEIEKTDTLYEKNGVVSIVFTKKIIPTDTVFFPKDVHYFTARLLYDLYKSTGKCDSSEFVSWDSVAYGSGFEVFLKTEKHYSKYLYLDVDKKTLYPREFYSERTILSPGKCMLPMIFIVFSFFGSFFSKAYQKRCDTMIITYSKNRKFWSYTIRTFFLLLAILILLGIIFGAGETAYMVNIFFALIFFASPFGSDGTNDGSVTLILIMFRVFAILAFTGLMTSLSTPTILLFFITSIVVVLAHVMGRVIPTPRFLLK